jgi:beta-lactamase class A
MFRLLPLALAAALAQPAESVLEANALERLRHLARENGGTLAVAAIDLETGHRFSLHGDTVLAQASVIKVPILWRVTELIRQGALRRDAAYTIEPSASAGGSGWIQDKLKQGPVRLTLDELLRAMIEHSDNTATNHVIGLVGMDSVNRSMLALGLTDTRLQRIMMDTAAAREQRENLSTANEMARLLELIWREERNGQAEFSRFLKLVPGEIRKVVPAEVPVWSKTGSVTGVRNEAAIVCLPRRPYAVVVLHAFQPKEVNITGPAAQIIYDHFRALDASNRFGHRVH